MRAIRCPRCGKLLTFPSGRPTEETRLASADFPFCSERCRLLDLGSWFAEDYKFSRPSTPSYSDDDEFYGDPDKAEGNPGN